jgi:hypothetical protein
MSTAAHICMIHEEEKWAMLRATYQEGGLLCMTHKQPSYMHLYNQDVTVAISKLFSQAMATAVDENSAKWSKGRISS